MEQTGQTPKDFGLKVRSHPDTLIVTARNKMGSSKEVRVSIGLSDKLIETTWLERGAALKANRGHASRFVADLLALKPHDPEEPSANFLWRDVPANMVIGFISGFVNCDTSIQTKSGPVTAFISNGASEELGLWDVAVISKKDGGDTPADTSLGLEVFTQDRTRGDGTNDREIMVSSRRRVSSQGVERLGLDDGAIRKAEADYRREKGLPEDAKPNFPDSIYRQVRPRPLLMIHLLDMREPVKPDQPVVRVEPESVVAWGISFPPTPETNKTHRTVEYVVNTTWWREQYGETTDEELDDELA